MFDFLKQIMIVRKNYSNFFIGDEIIVDEILNCGCCKDAPLTLIRILDTKDSKYLWINYTTLIEITN